MKKFVKWFIFWLFVCGGIAIAICYIVIPNETKSAIDIVVGYLNTPLGIVGGTTITLGFVAGVIIKVVYDRYKDTIRKDFEQAKQYAEEQKEQAKGYYELAIQEREEIIDILSSYSTRIDEIKNYVVKICKTSPNAKINAFGKEINDKCDELKQQLKEQLEETCNSFSNAIDRKTEVQLLKEEINELKNQLERLVEQYGEQERTDD